MLASTEFFASLRRGAVGLFSHVCSITNRTLLDTIACDKLPKAGRCGPLWEFSRINPFWIVRATTMSMGVPAWERPFGSLGVLCEYSDSASAPAMRPRKIALFGWWSLENHVEYDWETKGCLHYLRRTCFIARGGKKRAGKKKKGCNFIFVFSSAVQSPGIGT